MMALAKYRAYEPHKLVSIIVAADTLSVTRPTIYRWMDDRRLNYVKDEISGRTFIVRRDIENWNAMETDFESSTSNAIQ
jgi:excisionase family DNA binding protein